MAKAYSKSGVTVNKATKTERYYIVGYAPHKPAITDLNSFSWSAGRVSK